MPRKKSESKTNTVPSTQCTRCVPWIAVPHGMFVFSKDKGPYHMTLGPRHRSFRALQTTHCVHSVIRNIEINQRPIYIIQSLHYRPDAAWIFQSYDSHNQVIYCSNNTAEIHHFGPSDPGPCGCDVTFWHLTPFGGDRTPFAKLKSTFRRDQDCTF